MSLRGGFEQQAHCQLFRFTGQLDAYSDKQFGDFIASHRGSGQPLVIDLSAIDFIDSSGLGALVQLAKQCNTGKQKFLVVPLCPKSWKAEVFRRALLHQEMESRSF